MPPTRPTYVFARVGDDPASTFQFASGSFQWSTLGWFGTLQLKGENSHCHPINEYSVVVLSAPATGIACCITHFWVSARRCSREMVTPICLTSTDVLRLTGEFGVFWRCRGGHQYRREPDDFFTIAMISAFMYLIVQRVVSPTGIMMA